MRPSNSGSEQRAESLHRLARSYVLDALGKGNFDAIPYADNVTLRAPLCPGGSGAPLTGKANLLEKWWKPLPELIAATEVIDTCVSRSATAVAVEFLCHIRNPLCTLRVMDRFTVDHSGKIVEQENFFDPRDVANPGWQSKK